MALAFPLGLLRFVAPSVAGPNQLRNQKSRKSGSVNANETYSSQKPLSRANLTGGRLNHPAQTGNRGWEEATAPENRRSRAISSPSNASFDQGVLGEEVVEIGARNDMGCERDSIRGAGAVAQKALQNPKRELTLRARPLMDGGCNCARAEIGDKVGKKIGGDNRDRSGFFLALESAQHGHGVRRGDVAADQAWMIPKSAQSLLGGFFRAVMGLDRGQHFQMRVMTRDSLAEALNFLHVIGGGELAGEDCHLTTFAQKAAHEVADQATAGAGINGHGGDAIGTGVSESNMDGGLGMGVVRILVRGNEKSKWRGLEAEGGVELFVRCG